MTNPYENIYELCKWLKANGSGVYRPSAHAATVIEEQESELITLRAENDRLRENLEAMESQVEPAGKPTVAVTDDHPYAEDIDSQLLFFWGSAYWTELLKKNPALSEETKSKLLEISNERDRNRAAAPSHSQQSNYHDSGHQWDNQDKCKKCGDRDWYAGPVCSGKPVDSEDRTKYGFYTENYDGLPSIETLGTGDGKTLFSVLTYDDEKKTGLGLGYGRGEGVGVIVENVAQLDRHEAGITHQIKFESVGTIDSLMFILCRIREKQEAYCADRCPSHESEQSDSPAPDDIDRLVEHAAVLSIGLRDNDTDLPTESWRSLPDHLQKAINEKTEVLDFSNSECDVGN